MARVRVASERISQIELDTARGRDGRGCAFEGQGFEEAHGAAEVCAVSEVEDFGVNKKRASFGEAEVFCEREV